MENRGLKFLLLLTLTFFTAIVATGCVDQTDEGPPITTILSPTSGDVVRGNVPVIVTAVDEKNVQFIRVFVDGVQVLEQEGDQATFNWDTAPIADNRNHHVVAYAVDDDDNIGPSAITSVQVFAQVSDTLPQLVTVQNPLNGQSVGGLVNVAIGVDPDINNPIDSVAIFIDGEKVVTDVTFPYIYEWDASNLVNGSSHTIFGIAYDRFGFNVTSSVTSVIIASDNPGNITAPIAVIENPIENQTVSGLVNVVTHVSNVEFNPVDSVRFFIDGAYRGTSTTFPFTYQWETSNLPNNSRHTIFSVAYDQLGFNVSANFINVTVSSNVIPDTDVPVVELIFPVAGNIISKSAFNNTINVVANARDDFGITNVEFYIDGVLMGTDSDPLYEIQWDLTNYVVDIDHSIFVRAFDPSGNVGVVMGTIRLVP